MISTKKHQLLLAQRGPPINQPVQAMKISQFPYNYQFHESLRPRILTSPSLGGGIKKLSISGLLVQLHIQRMFIPFFKELIIEWLAKVCKLAVKARAFFLQYQRQSLLTYFFLPAGIFFFLLPPTQWHILKLMPTVRYLLIVYQRSHVVKTS